MMLLPFNNKEKMLLYANVCKSDKQKTKTFIFFVLAKMPKFATSNKT